MTSSIQATVQDGQVTVSVPDAIPDGTRVEVRVVPMTDQIGMDESEWKTDAASMKEWDEWLETVEPVEFAPPTDFDRLFRDYNIEAVRKQMFGEQS